MDFQSAKSKKSLVFAELIVEFPTKENVAVEDESFPTEHIFLISTSDSWYGDIGDTLYRRGVDSVLRRCLTHEEAEIVLNDSHSGACGGHLSRLATA